MLFIHTVNVGYLCFVVKDGVCSRIRCSEYYTLCVCIILCGCSKPEDNNSVSSSSVPTLDSNHTLHLLYNETDSFNPYAVTTKENQELCYLLYDSLVTLDSSFEPVYKIAQTITVEGKTCTIKLKSVLYGVCGHSHTIRLWSI